MHLNRMQSLEESASDRSARLSFSSRHPPASAHQPNKADVDDHHHHHCASGLLSHFTPFFCNASVTDNVFLHTFGPIGGASIHNLYALLHPKSWQCGIFHYCFAGSISQTLVTGRVAKYEKTRKQKIDTIIHKNGRTAHWKYFSAPPSRPPTAHSTRIDPSRWELWFSPIFHILPLISMISTFCLWFPIFSAPDHYRESNAWWLWLLRRVLPGAKHSNL